MAAAAVPITAPAALTAVQVQSLANIPALNAAAGSHNYRDFRNYLRLYCSVLQANGNAACAGAVQTAINASIPIRDTVRVDFIRAWTIDGNATETTGNAYLDWVTAVNTILPDDNPGGGAPPVTDWPGAAEDPLATVFRAIVAGGPIANVACTPQARLGAVRPGVTQRAIDFDGILDRVGNQQINNEWADRRNQFLVASKPVLVVQDKEYTQTGSFATTGYHSHLVQDAIAGFGLNPAGPVFMSYIITLLGRKLNEIIDLNPTNPPDIEQVITAFVYMLGVMFVKGDPTKNAGNVLDKIQQKGKGRGLEIVYSGIQFPKRATAMWVECALTQTKNELKLSREDVRKQVGTFLKQYSRLARCATLIDSVGVTFLQIPLPSLPDGKFDILRYHDYLDKKSAGEDRGDERNFRIIEDQELRNCPLLVKTPEFDASYKYQKYLERSSAIQSHNNDSGDGATDESKANYERLVKSRVLPSQAELEAGRPDLERVAHEASSGLKILDSGWGYSAPTIGKLAEAHTCQPGEADGNGNRALNNYNDIGDGESERLWESINGVERMLRMVSHETAGVSTDAIVTSLRNIGGDDIIARFISVIRSNIVNNLTVANFDTELARTNGVVINNKTAFLHAYFGKNYNLYKAELNMALMPAFVAKLEESECLGTTATSYAAEFNAIQAANNTNIDAFTRRAYGIPLA